MSSAHLSADRRPHLVLLQGGKDDAPEGDSGAEWQLFCDQIGWQSPTSEPADDLEERLAAGLFAKPTPENNVVQLDLVRAVRTALDTEEAAAQADFAPTSGAFRIRTAEPLRASDRRQSGRDRVTFAVAATALAVAAVAFLVVARLAVSPPRSSSVSFPQASAEIAPHATVAPRLDDADAVDDAVDGAPIEAPSPPEVTPPRRALRPQRKASKPAPGPKTQPSEPPGSLVARRSFDDSDSESPMAHLVKTGASLRDPHEMAMEPRPVVADLADLAAPSAISGDPPVSWGVVGAYRSGLPAADTVAPASAPLLASTSVWSDGPEAVDSPDALFARRASASWSLSPTRDRWIGASLTPPPPSGTAQSNVGVMVQVDLGRALGNKL